MCEDEVVTECYMSVMSVSQIELIQPSESELHPGQGEVKYRDIDISRLIRLYLEQESITLHLRVKTLLERIMACECRCGLRLRWRDGQQKFAAPQYGIETEAQPQKEPKSEESLRRNILSFSLTSFHFL